MGWFLKMNPKHQVPVLAIDENTFITESVVICQYLCKRAGDHSPYPADPLKQAKIDEAIADAKTMKFMYFAMTKLFGRPESAEGLKEAEDSMKALNDLRFKNGNTYMVGDSLTLADLVLAVNITMCTIIGQYDMKSNFPNLLKGLTEIQKLPEWAPIDKRMMEYIASMMAKKAASANK